MNSSWKGIEPVLTVADGFYPVRGEIFIAWPYVLTTSAPEERDVDPVVTGQISLLQSEVLRACLLL